MDYQGPTAEDLREIRALNAAFLRASNHHELASDRGISCRPLTEIQIRRLSRAPFLLFSFREHDNEYWIRVIADDPQQDLLRPAVTASEPILELQVAGLGFLWQLSRRNPYVARLACGAPVRWCESIARLTFVDLVRRAANRGDLTLPRFGTSDHVSHRLLQSGVSARLNLQCMSQQFALQAMLTRNSPPHYAAMPAAACRFPTAAQRIADRDARVKTEV